MEVIFEGFITIVKTRECDIDKNPIGDWNIKYGTASKANNPYVFPNIAAAKSNLKLYKQELDTSYYNPLHDWSTRPIDPHLFLGDIYDHKKYESSYQQWYAEAVISYTETVKTIIPGRISHD